MESFWMCLHHIYQNNAQYKSGQLLKLPHQDIITFVINVAENKFREQL